MPLLILTLSDNMKRYAMSWGTDEDKFVYVNPVEQSNGNWVKWEDYARLKTEVEVLKGKVLYWKIEAHCDHGRWLRCLEDLEILRKSK